MECIRARRTRDYQYDRHELDRDGNIRLLELTPGSQRDELVGEFKTANVDNPADEFESLSYTWGRPRFSYRLWIRYEEDGAPKVAKIGITKNLWRALKALRLGDRTRTLWADAVCINQKDIQERELQVAMMGRIYSASTRTTVYLGEKIPNLGLAAGELQTVLLFTSMQSLMGLSALDLSKDDASNVLARMLLIVGLKTCCCPSPRALSAAITQTKQALKWYRENRVVLSMVHRWWRGWITLFSRPWFRRAWVVQEFVRSPNLSIQTGSEIICGDGAKLSIDDLNGILLQMGILGPGFAVRDRDEFVPHLYGTRNLGRLYELRSVSRTEAQRPALLSVLGFFRNYDATDPHDRLYALLGLSREADEPRLAPKYGEDIRETLLRYAGFLIAQPNGMQVLYDFRCGHDCEGLASWVPLWTETLDSRSL